MHSLNWNKSLVSLWFLKSFISFLVFFVYKRCIFKPLLVSWSDPLTFSSNESLLNSCYTVFDLVNFWVKLIDITFQPYVCRTRVFTHQYKIAVLRNFVKRWNILAIKCPQRLVYLLTPTKHITTFLKHFHECILFKSFLVILMILNTWHRRWPYLFSHIKVIFGPMPIYINFYHFFLVIPAFFLKFFK